MDSQIAYSVADTARRLGISRSFLYQELERGKLASIKLAKRRLIRTADADAYLAAHCQQATAA